MQIKEHFLSLVTDSLWNRNVWGSLAGWFVCCQWVPFSSGALPAVDPHTLKGTNPIIQAHLWSATKISSSNSYIKPWILFKQKFIFYMEVAASILTPWNSAWSTPDSLYKFYVSHHGGNHDNKPTEKANYFLLLKRTIITSHSKIWCRTNTKALWKTDIKAVLQNSLFISYPEKN